MGSDTLRERRLAPMQNSLGLLSLVCKQLRFSNEIELLVGSSAKALQNTVVVAHAFGDGLLLGLRLEGDDLPSIASRYDGQGADELALPVAIGNDCAMGEHKARVLKRLLRKRRTR
ncbi:hypothetical protein J2X20_003255 [Pelomonas saccharophila]|uniref:Uncharacterized protein n=1 Tax=Roseateles saccharophilus TaxID=304 RepID=A0ABU1YP07_ROSSA|nr:hypothetical protein [Roseateles saccharophilus]MDR7270597.1 hypothetical protein [Roseateles saccharophilus]